MPRMANDSDVAQARILLSALNDHIARISGLLEKAERRSPAKYGPQEWPAGCGSLPAVNALTPAPNYD